MSHHRQPISIQPPLLTPNKVEHMKKLGLDAIDIRILSAIQQYGQLSKIKLAELVNLSPTPCWARLDKLKAAGFVRGYHADLVLDRLCDFTQVIVTVTLTHHRKIDFDRFESHIRTVDEVTECLVTGGGIDYVLKVFAPSLSTFQTVMDDLLAAEIGIDRYMTYIVTRQVKKQPPNLQKLVAKKALQDYPPK